MSTKASKKAALPKKQRVPIWLPLIIVAGVALLVLAGTGSGHTPASAGKPQVSGGPALQVDREKIDLGDVPLGQTVNAQFEITNVGDQPLRFTQKPYIQVAAGC